MGRSTTRSIVPRAYIIAPIPRILDNAVAGAAYDPTTIAVYPVNSAPIVTIANRATESGIYRLPLGIARGENYSSAKGGAAYVHGLGWSTNLMGSDSNLNTIDIKKGAVAGSAVYSSGANALTSTTASNPISGFIERGVLNSDFYTTAGIWIKSSTAGTGELVFNRPAIKITPTTGVTAKEPAGFVVISAEIPCTFTDGTGLTASHYYFGPESHLAGPASGFYALLPMPTTPVANGLGSLTTVRTIVAPMDMRVHEIALQSRSSAAGNSARLYNVTKGNVIVAETSMTSATANCTVRAATTLTDRNIRKGDVIALQAKTGATGIVALGAYLIVHTKSHAVTYRAQDWLISIGGGTAGEIALADAAVSGKLRPRNDSHVTIAGPATGSLIFLPFGDHLNSEGAFPTGTTDHVVGTVHAHCDLTIIGGQVVYNTGSAGNTFKIRNTTDGVDLTSAIALTGTAAAQRANIRPTDLSNNVLPKGKYLSLYMTTGATAPTAVSGYLVAHVRGHVNSSPSYD